ncbi:hypothetical protein GDO81_020634, partial [Engystomops pustulosus]
MGNFFHKEGDNDEQGSMRGNGYVEPSMFPSSLASEDGDGEPVTYLQEEEPSKSSSPTPHQDHGGHTRVSDTTLPSTSQTMANPGPTPRKQDEAGPGNHPRTVIFSMEDNTRIWSQVFDDYQHFNPSDIRDEAWRLDVENSSIVIFHFTSKYEISMQKMEAYMEFSVSRKGHEGVMVVMEDIPAPEDMIRSMWKQRPYAECELQIFTRINWVLRDPRLQQMVEKINGIRAILSGDSQKMTDVNEEEENLQEPESSRKSVTYFTHESTETETHWLVPILRTDHKADFRVTKIGKIKKKLGNTEGSSSMSCILYLSKETFGKILRTKNSHPPVVDNKLLCYFGDKKVVVMVVVDDLDDGESEEDLRAQYGRSMFSRVAPLFLFRREEKKTYFSCYNEVEMKDKWIEIQESIERRMKVQEPPRTSELISNPPPGLHSTETSDNNSKTTRDLGTVGIFSRSSESDYSWLVKQLRSEVFSPYVSEVRPFYISNNQSGQIYEELSRCSFGILYHTKNRGRVNVTDVTDSLYDEELKAMNLLL